MALPEKKSQLVNLADGITLTSNFRSISKAESVRAGSVWGDGLRKLLDQPNCVAVRIYFGRKKDGSLTLVLVGTDKDGKDLTDGPMLDDVMPCPPFCDPKSPFNG